MDSELLYLQRRAGFHRRMASEAASPEARYAHQAFVRAYLKRIEERTPRPRDEARAATPPAATRPQPPLAAAVNRILVA